ncbi:hypothetical protein [Mesorhizobium sp. M0408]|uniref:hypothetical protein n=1 Tax=Mesorhizobium sp. M0408 TaxID=2956942 RepID=UPI00333BB8CA
MPIIDVPPNTNSAFVSAAGDDRLGGQCLEPARRRKDRHAIGSITVMLPDRNQRICPRRLSLPTMPFRPCG